MGQGTGIVCIVAPLKGQRCMIGSVQPSPATVRRTGTRFVKDNFHLFINFTVYFPYESTPEVLNSGVLCILVYFFTIGSHSSNCGKN